MPDPDMDDPNANMCMAPAAAAPAPGGSEPKESSEGGGIGINSPEVMKERAEQEDTAGKVIDATATAASLGKGIEKVGGVGVDRLGGGLAGVASLPGDVMATIAGAKEVANGDNANGVVDTGIGAAGVVGDVAGIAGQSGIGDAANTVKGGLEIGKGAGQLISAVQDSGPMAPGESRRDSTDEAVDGVENILKGGADAGSAAPNPWIKGGAKALGAGMAVGNMLAPVVFGDKNESSNAQTADGVYHGSTGNGAVDWMFGVGKYSNGRFGDSSAKGGGGAGGAPPSSDPTGGAGGAPSS
jgi:hypothetical protein